MVAGQQSEAAEMVADAPPSSDDDTRARYLALLAADRRSTAIATALTLAVALIWSVMPMLWVCVSGCTFLAIRQLGRNALDRGQLALAVSIFAFGLWGSALVIVYVIPIALPIMMFNLVTPVIIAGTYLNVRQHRPLTVGAVVVSAAMGLLGFLQDGYRIQDRADDWVVALVITAFMVEHTALFTATVRDANRVNNRNYVRAMEANAELALSEDELRRSRRRVVDVADRERRRIERDIHDGAQQRLVSAALRLELAGLEAEQGTTIDRARLDGIRVELNDATNELRELARGIFPSILADHGLRDAVHSVARLNPQTVTVDIPDEVELPDRIARALYFIAVEALQNAAKHAGHHAAVHIELRLDGGLAVLAIRDDGIGFDHELQPDVGGLANMADRAAAERGTMRVISGAGRGTVIHTEIPLPVDADRDIT